jgi:bla regulator protein blaR1
MNHFESWMLSYLLNSLWQVPLLFVAGWAMARLLSMAGAEAEHRVWVSVLLLQSLLPAFSALPWEGLREKVNWFGTAHGGGSARVSVVIGEGTRLGVLHLPHVLATAIGMIYAGVCAVFIARFLLRCRRLTVLRGETDAASLTGEAAKVWMRCSAQFGIENVEIRVSSRVFGPITFGIFRRLVLLPSGMIAGLSEPDLYTVIAHEFAHLRRNDFLKNLLYGCFSLPVSYHPLSWRARERLMETREMVCDEMVAAISGKEEYAHSLLRLASLLVEGVPIRTPHAIGIFDANTLERRLMRLTEKRRETRGIGRSAIAVVCVLLGTGTCASAVALATNVDEMFAAGSDSSKSSEPHTVPAAEMVKYLISKVPPVYPEDAKKARIQGKVVLHAIIGKDGAIENLTVVSGPDALQQSALDAVRHWTYRPFLVDGQAVVVKTTITVIYELKR